MRQPSLIAVLSVALPVLVALAITFVLSSGCNGHGRLTSTFQCECDPIWSGSRCEKCLCLFGRCPKTPAGPFHTNSRCECDDMWDGALCNVCCVSPPAANNTCLTIDKVQGQQVQCNGNRCVENFFPPKCHKFCKKDLTCNGHGVCNAAGDCDCDDGWGLSVETNTCEMCANQCSSHGKCQYGPECACQANYFGPDCNQECKCNPEGGECECSDVTCATGYCRCNTDAQGNPLFVGDDCSTACPQVNGLSCNGRGRCTGDGKCECQPAFKGALCNCQDDVTCNAPKGVCSSLGSGCICAGNFDPASNCSACLPNFYGTNCGRYCSAKDTCSDFDCIDDGTACDCENQGRDPLPRATVCTSTVQNIFFKDQTPVPLRLQRPDTCKQVDLVASVSNQTGLYAPDDIVQLKAVDYGVLTPALVPITVSYETVVACDRCSANYFPASGDNACTTYCTEALCNNQGTCDADGNCACKEHVNGTFCEVCDASGDNQYNFGPEPASTQNEACVNFCYAQAKNYSECFEQYRIVTSSDVKLNYSKPCDPGEVCRMQQSTSTVSCNVNKQMTPCFVPTTEQSNGNALGSSFAHVSLSDGSNFTCNFCNSNGICEGGECLCSGETVVDTITYEERPRKAGEAIRSHERIKRVPSGYHGPHCFLTCGQGNDASCSDNGQCVWDSTVNAPRCLCDPAQELTTMWLAQNKNYTECITKKNKNCTQLKPATPFPQPLYFGQQCEFHAPLFFYKTADNDVVQTVCAGQPVQRETLYALQDTDKKWKVYDNKQCTSDADCYASQQSRTDVFCNMTSLTNVCTKLSCDCGTARGGTNCGLNCPYTVEVCTNQQCRISQCGERFPIVDTILNYSIQTGDTIACQHGTCVVDDSKKSESGDSFEKPAANFKPVSGECKCSNDASKSATCNKNINPIAYLQNCCGQGTSKYGPGYCSQDCDCSDASRGQCNRPFSNECSCNKGNCGQDCESTCASCGTHGSCVTKGSRACQCACAAGYVNKLPNVGLDVALLYTGAACAVQCPGVANIQKPYDIADNLPGPDADVQLQEKFWQAYRNASVCSGHGACTLNVPPGQCECATGYAGSSCNFSCAENAMPPCLQQNGWCNGSMSVCNHGQCTVRSNQETTSTCMCNANFRTIDLASVATVRTTTQKSAADEWINGVTNNCSLYTLGNTLDSGTPCTFCNQDRVPPCAQCEDGFFTNADENSNIYKFINDPTNNYFGSCNEDNCPVRNCASQNCAEDDCVQASVPANVRAQMVRKCDMSYKVLCDAEDESDPWPPVNNWTDIDYYVGVPPNPGDVTLLHAPFCDCNILLASVNLYDENTNAKCRNCSRNFDPASHCYKCNSTSFWTRNSYFVGDVSIAFNTRTCASNVKQDCPLQQNCSMFPEEWSTFTNHPLPKLFSVDNRKAAVTSFSACYATNNKTKCPVDGNDNVIFNHSRTKSTIATFECVSNATNLLNNTFNCISEHYQNCTDPLRTGSYCEIDLSANQSTTSAILPFDGLTDAFSPNGTPDDALFLLTENGGCEPVKDNKLTSPTLQTKWETDKKQTDFLYLTGDTCQNMFLKQEVVDKYAQNLTYRNLKYENGFQPGDFITGTVPNFKCTGASITNTYRIEHPGRCQWTQPTCYDIASPDGVPVKTSWSPSQTRTVYKIVEALNPSDTDKQWVIPNRSFLGVSMEWLHFIPENIVTCGGYSNGCNKTTQQCFECDAENTFLPSLRCQDSTKFSDYVKFNTLRT